eukprot:365760-Chlamydomonas_euryale.AAC.8
MRHPPRRNANILPCTAMPTFSVPPCTGSLDEPHRRGIPLSMCLGPAPEYNNHSYTTATTT